MKQTERDKTESLREITGRGQREGKDKRELASNWSGIQIEMEFMEGGKKERECDGRERWKKRKDERLSG